jgi:hypothetical protein
MTVRLEQLTLAELRDLSRQHGLPDTYNAKQMRSNIRQAVTAVTAVTPNQERDKDA